jgi:hypothetical protein
MNLNIVTIFQAAKAGKLGGCQLTVLLTVFGALKWHKNLVKNKSQL